MISFIVGILLLVISDYISTYSVKSALWTSLSAYVRLSVTGGLGDRANSGSPGRPGVEKQRKEKLALWPW